MQTLQQTSTKYITRCRRGNYMIRKSRTDTYAVQKLLKSIENGGKLLEGYGPIQMTKLKRKQEMDWINVISNEREFSIEFEFWHEDGTIRCVAMSNHIDPNRMDWWLGYSKTPGICQDSKIYAFPKGMLYKMFINLWS